MEINKDLKIEYNCVYDEDDGLMENFVITINDESIVISIDDAVDLKEFIKRSLEL